MEENMKHPWEYTQLVQFATPSIKLDFSTQEGRQGIGNVSGAIFKKLPEIIDQMHSGGGWQVSSHSILLVDGSVMVSVLLQRLKKA